jgi:molybdenum cofactor cytidylyltransferase
MIPYSSALKENAKMTAVIMAAGFSKRFGRQKLLMKIGGKPILLHVIEAVEKSGFEEIILVCRHKAVEKLIIGKNIKVAHNNDAVLGISSSVKCGVRSASPADAYIFFTGDQPFIDVDTILKLKATFNEKKGSIIVPRFNGVAGNPVIFSAKWADSLKMLSGDTGGRSIIAANANDVYYVDLESSVAGTDIDTRDDYAAYNGDE